MQRRHPDNWTASSLNDSNCLSLKQIVGSFSAPITEEHAWAVVYELVKTLDLCLSNPTFADRMFIVNSLNHVMIHLDGNVHEDTFILDQNKVRFRHDRTALTSENKALSEIGLVIFTALDYGLGEDQERALSDNLETLLELLASEENVSRENELSLLADEGIEYDEEDLIITKSGLCKKVMQCCASHLAVASEAQTHFKNVCRALVSEALDLSKFMEKVQKHETESNCKELEEMGLQDWARLWRQILKDLRDGVKLKKIEYTKTPIEYELTPYEILMEDIRERRFSLNKIMVDGELPHRIKKDAHDVILQFIRSRPPLKPASERQLNPIRKESTPVELLMESIRNSDARASLRKTGGPRRRPQANRQNSESSRTKLLDDENIDHASAEDFKDARRKVTLDPSLVDDLLNFSDGEESEFEEGMSKQGSLDSILSHESSNWNLLNNNQSCDIATTNNTSSPTKSNKRGHQRRHSLTVCETPNMTNKLHKPPLFETQTSQISNVSAVTSSGSATPTSQPGTPKFEAAEEISNPLLDSTSIAQMQARLHAEFLQSEHWATALQTLDLTLDEVIHIRTVLTKAELESLPLDGTMKEDVEKGKICFLCMKSKFGFFNRGMKCELCSRQVCTKCFTKMEIPLEQLSTIPVISLSPNTPTVLSNPNNESMSLRKRMSQIVSGSSRAVSTGSAPTSPAFQRKKAVSMVFDTTHESDDYTDSIQPNLAMHQGMSSSLTSFDRRAVDEEYGHSSLGHCSEVVDECDAAGGPKSLPFQKHSNSGGGGYFQRFSSSRLSQRNRQPQEPPQRQICMDCKEMILQVVRAQSTARRLQMAKSLFQQQILANKT